MFTLSRNQLVFFRRYGIRRTKSVRFGADALSTAKCETDSQVVYTAPMARAVRLMKGVSMTSCILTSIGMPTLCLLNQASQSPVAKWAMCGTIMIFGIGTTTLFHLLFKPYVLKMWMTPPSDEISPNTILTVTQVTLFGGTRETQFPVSAVKVSPPSMHPMRSFMANSQHYFIHPECVSSEKLVKALMHRS